MVIEIKRNSSSRSDKLSANIILAIIFTLFVLYNCYFIILMYLLFNFINQKYLCEVL